MATAGWFCAVLSLLVVSMAVAGQSPPDWGNLRRFFRHQVAEAGIVGASLVIVREGKVQAEEYAGYQDNATKRPVDRDTIYAHSNGDRLLARPPRRQGGSDRS